jgi:hypothetical protein
MSVIPGLTDFTLIEPDERSNSKVKASISYRIEQPPRQLNWYSTGRPCNTICYEITYRVLKKHHITQFQKRLRIPNIVIGQLLTTLNIIIKNLDSYVFVEETKVLNPKVDYEYEETDQLSNIDGYLATTGVRAKIVLRATLTQEEKDTGMQELLKQMEYKQEPRVHLWKLNREENL